MDISTILKLYNFAEKNDMILRLHLVDIHDKEFYLDLNDGESKLDWTANDLIMEKEGRIYAIDLDYVYAASTHPVQEAGGD